MALSAIGNRREASGRRDGLLSSLAFQSNLARSGKYRADVDGLRAVAVLSVLFFHAQILHSQGGFVGVDVFFVISGYLITTLIARDMEESKFSFASFYERRMRRIFPALFGVLFFCIVAAAVLFSPQDLLIFGKTLLATTFFASNIYFWLNAPKFGYFSNVSLYQALLHTWSLAVEEQFYLVFPAVLLLVFRWAKHRIRVWLWILTAVSFGLNLWATAHRPVAAFYLSVPRAWELLMGGLLAAKAVPALHNQTARNAAGLLGLGMVIFAVFTFDSATAFPGFNALLPCVGTWLVIYAGEQGRSFVKTALSVRPLVFIGIISYSLYLWHWPLLVFTRYFVAGELTGAEAAGVLACSAVMAFISFEYIERPFRGSGSSFTRRQIFALGLTASMISAAAGLIAYLTQGVPLRYSATTRQLVAENMSRRDDYDQSCGNWRIDAHSLADIRFCSLGNPSSEKIMFWGDSHVEQLYPAVTEIYNAGDLRSQGALFVIANGCLPATHLNSIGGYHCDTFSRLAMVRAEMKDIDTVFIGFDTWWAENDGFICLSVNGRCTKNLSSAETMRQFLAELSENIRTLRDLGKRVIVSLPFPMYDKSIPELEMRNAVFGRFGLGGKATDFTSPTVREEIRSTAIAAGAQTFDPRASLCDQHGCVTEVKGVSIYIDSHHLAASQVGILKDNLRQVLQQSR